jgi:cytochrome b subunit of formate dehydrogenase
MLQFSYDRNQTNLGEKIVMVVGVLFFVLILIAGIIGYQSIF